MPDAQGRLFADDVAVQLDIDANTWRAYVSRGQAPEPDDRVVEGSKVRPVWNPDTIAEYRSTRGRRDVAAVVWERAVNGDSDDPNRYVRRKVTYGPWEPDPDGAHHFDRLGQRLTTQHAAGATPQPTGGGQ